MSSRLDNAIFGHQNARVTMKITVRGDVYKNEVLFLTRPSGFVFSCDPKPSMVPLTDNLLYSQEELLNGMKYKHGCDTEYY